MGSSSTRVSDLLLPVVTDATTSTPRIANADLTRCTRADILKSNETTRN
jgi:hypothetical protein